jgi:hypothetical protein
MIPKSGNRFPACAKPLVGSWCGLALRRAKAGRKRSCSKKRAFKSPRGHHPASRCALRRICSRESRSMMPSEALAEEGKFNGLRRCWCGGPPVERMSGDRNPGRSPSCFALRASQNLHSRTSRSRTSSEALAEEGHLGVAQPAERPLREREDAGAKPAAQSIVLRAARFAGFALARPAKQVALRSLGGGGLPLAPLAQLVERSAYTRRELRTGARLEVRILQGVPFSGISDQGSVIRCYRHRNRFLITDY